MRTVKAHHRQTANDNKTQYALLADCRKGLLGGRYDARRLPERHAESRLPVPHPYERRQHDSRLSSSPLDRRHSSPDWVAPGSRYDDLIRHSNDDSAFWFVSPATGVRVSPAYDYATLQRIAGKSRHELDFPFLLSVMPPAKRMAVCIHISHLASHRSPSSTAHLPPFPDFVAQVRAHFSPAQDVPSPSTIPPSSYLRPEDSDGERRRASNAARRVVVRQILSMLVVLMVAGPLAVLARHLRPAIVSHVSHYLKQLTLLRHLVRLLFMIL